MWRPGGASASLSSLTASKLHVYIPCDQSPGRSSPSLYLSRPPSRQRTLQGEGLHLWTFFPRGTGPDAFFFFFYNQISTWLHGDLSYSFGYIRNLSVSSWFSVWIVPCVDGFLMWLWGVGEAELRILLLCHLDPPLKCISLAVYLGVELRIQGIPVFNLLNLTFSFPNWL